MVEIFTVGSGQNSAATRSVSNEIKLSTASDVYFGSAVAGIAFYEKSGADLRVTLLDGQEITLQDFFVIGPQGQYSRLLDGGANGSVEVTGLIAPEPFVPPELIDEAPVVTTGVDTASAESPEEMPIGTETADSVGTDSPAGDQDTGAVGIDVGGVGAFSGMPFDRLLFGLAAVPSLAALLHSGKDDSPATPLKVAAFTGGSQGDDQPGDDEGPGIDTSIAAMLDGDGDAALDAFFPAEDPSNSRIIGTEGHDGEAVLTFFTTVLDGFHTLPTEG